MKKMLVVGGAGYVGGFVTDLFLNRSDYQVSVYDNLLYESRYLKEVSFIFGDIRDTKKLGGIINDFDVVIWLAALVGDGACAVNVELSEEINCKTVKWVIDTYKNGLLVFMSTCSVYGQSSQLLDEESPINPLSVYAATKLEAERYVVDHAQNYLIFRLGTLYGLSDAHSRLRFDLVVNILTLRAVMGEKLNVFGGTQWRPILHVRDVAYAIAYCLDNDIMGLYNLSERNVEISDLANQIASHIPGTEVVFQDLKFEDLRDYKVKVDKIMSTGWKPKINLSEGITEMTKVFLEKRVKNVRDPIYNNADYLRQTGGFYE